MFNNVNFYNFRVEKWYYFLFIKIVKSKIIREGVGEINGFIFYL